MRRSSCGSRARLWRGLKPAVVGRSCAGALAFTSRLSSKAWARHLPPMPSCATRTGRDAVPLAREAVARIEARGRRPILCGATGLYFKAFLEGWGEAPAADAVLRAEIEATPLGDLLAELARRDPATYQRIDRQNPRRVIRAIEVIRLTGKPFSQQRASWQQATRDPEHAAAFFGLNRPAADLRARIDARVEDMFRRGLVAETEALLKRGLAENRTASQALGYRQVMEHLRGERGL